MIVDIFLKIIIFFVKFLALAIPNWFIPDAFIDGFLFIVERALIFDGILPMVHIINALMLILYFHIIILTFKLISGLLSIVRGGGKIDPE